MKPVKSHKELNGSLSKSKSANKSAKRKWTEALIENENHTLTGLREEVAESGQDIEALAQADAPLRKRRGRPKASQNKGSPTPEGDLPPEERYFFQNRSGPPNTSNDTLTSLKLLTYEEYFDQIKKYRDRHELDRRYLVKLHLRSFSQWRFELMWRFNICLYGWGSKRQLLTQYAEWIHQRSATPPKTVVVNRYNPTVNIRTILNTLTTVVFGEKVQGRQATQPLEILDSILSHLTSQPPAQPILLMINSKDAYSLRCSATQSLLATLAAQPLINLISTADTPSFPLMWNSLLRDKFNFVFHDCATYAPYDAELSVVDDVHELLGHKGRRVGGQEGIGHVLRGLPNNGRLVYRILLTQILSVEQDGEAGHHTAMTAIPQKEGEVGIEYRVLYQKVLEEIIGLSEMNFRILLKEFYDHQMIMSRRDKTGTEILCVPLDREVMESVLEDLVSG
jgi:origin recognition complex subunit 2